MPAHNGKPFDYESLNPAAASKETTFKRIMLKNVYWFFY